MRFKKVVIAIVSVLSLSLFTGVAFASSTTPVVHSSTSAQTTTVKPDSKSLCQYLWWCHLTIQNAKPGSTGTVRPTEGQTPERLNKVMHTLVVKDHIQYGYTDQVEWLIPDTGVFCNRFFLCDFSAGGWDNSVLGPMRVYVRCEMPARASGSDKTFVTVQFLSGGNTRGWPRMVKGFSRPCNGDVQEINESNWASILPKDNHNVHPTLRVLFNGDKADVSISVWNEHDPSYIG